MKTLFEWHDRYVSLDLETTGFDAEYDEVIECAAIRYEDGAETGRFETLINPGTPIDEFITELSGITNEMLAGAPSWAETLPGLIAFIGDDVLLGHNLSFDLRFFEAAGAPIENAYIDTMFLSRRLWPEEKHHRLCDLRERLLGTNGAPHRSGPDAEDTAAVYEKIRAYCLENDKDIAAVARRHKHTLHAADITSEVDEFNTDSLVYGRTFVFTGTLSFGQRRDAMQMVVDCGGLCGDNVTAKTNYLVLGTQDYSKVGETGKSSKQRKAEKLQLDGNDIQVISEGVFLQMIKDARL